MQLLCFHPGACSVRVVGNANSRHVQTIEEVAEGGEWGGTESSNNKIRKG